MADKQGPLPAAHFGSRKLPIETWSTGSSVIRIHALGRGALFFGSSGDNRFDDPKRRYGVCYSAGSLQGAFAETCLREVGATLVSMARLSTRAITVLTLRSNLRLVSLHGAGLAPMGATALVSSGAYEVSQAWSQAIHDHPAGADGIAYRSNHDNGELCVALFDRCRRHLEESSTEPLVADPARLAMLLDRYRIGLT